MVHCTRLAFNFRPGPEMVSFDDDKSPVKLEIEDSFAEEQGPLKKRLKSSSLQNQLRDTSNEFLIPPGQYNPLDEPSPLGLRLRKSPSLLDLIQMRLSQGNASSSGLTPSIDVKLGNKEVKGSPGSGAIDKLKASNFPASHLKIGSWEYISRHEGDLVAKCYFAKHKLVWEVLDGGLKSKIEIQWSDIMGLKANCPDDNLGTLTIILARQPLFFRETNPQPRKHTLWQAAADFTDGQASLHRQHFLQCPQGLLNKHYEKLIQCDMRINFLSQQPELVLDSPYFASQPSAFEDPNKSGGHEFNQLETAKGSHISSVQHVTSPSLLRSSSLEVEQNGPLCIAPEYLSKEASSPRSGVIEGNGNGNGEGFNFQVPKNWEQLKVPGLRTSMSMSDLVNHIENQISGQMTSGGLPFSGAASECQHMLENIAQILLSDTQTTAASDEKYLMSRVNSLCCLLQDPVIIPAEQINEQSHHDSGEPNRASDSTPASKSEGDIVVHEVDPKNVPTFKQSQTMSRKDSFGDLLLRLPRISSLPKFLFDISEDSENQGG